MNESVYTCFSSVFSLNKCSYIFHRFWPQYDRTVHFRVKKLYAPNTWVSTEGKFLKILMKSGCWPIHKKLLFCTFSTLIVIIPEICASSALKSHPRFKLGSLAKIPFERLRIHTPSEAPQFFKVEKLDLYKGKSLNNELSLIKSRLIFLFLTSFPGTIQQRPLCKHFRTCAERKTNFPTLLHRRSKWACCCTCSQTENTRRPLET